MIARLIIGGFLFISAIDNLDKHWFISLIQLMIVLGIGLTLIPEDKKEY